MEEKDRKKIIALSILILVIIPIWIRAFKPRPGVTSSPPSQEVAPPATEIGGSIKEAAPQKIDIIQDKEKEEAQRKRMALPWSRDPFMAQGKLAKKGPSRPEALALSGIIWDEKKPAAIINDNIVSVGDEIQGKKVIKIEKNKVILQEDGEEYILRLEE